MSTVPAPGMYLESLRNPAIDYKMSASQSVIELQQQFLQNYCLVFGCFDNPTHLKSYQSKQQSQTIDGGKMPTFVLMITLRQEQKTLGHTV